MLLSGHSLFTKPSHIILRTECHVDEPDSKCGVFKISMNPRKNLVCDFGRVMDLTIYLNKMYKVFSRSVLRMFCYDLYQNISIGTLEMLVSNLPA